MFTQKEIENYADIMIWALEKAGSQTGKTFQAGDQVTLTFPRYAYDFAEHIYARGIKKGWHIHVVVDHSPKMKKAFYTHGNSDQLSFLPEWQKEITKQTAGTIHIIGEEDLLNLANVNSNQLTQFIRSRRPLRDIKNKNEQEGKFAWTLGLWPSQDMAEKANISLENMFNQVRKACFLDKENPVQEWENLYQYNQKVCQWLRDLEIEWFHMKSEKIDLKIKLGEQRKFISTSGHNIPSFEVFTSPDKHFTEGTFYADQASFRNGNVVKGVQLTFKEGKVISFSAEEGEKFLESQLNLDDGAKFVGEFSLTDKRYSNIDKFMADTLYDENFGGLNGNSHIAIGASYTDTYAGSQKDLSDEQSKSSKGFNTSVLHWDLVNSEKKTVKAICKDGKEIIIYDDGQFTMNEE
ncbi:MAG: aminopeptidase [Alphaproteobacteria bacterium]|nr:aminopeptidase [Alphaproteobacteria bacterium]